MVKSRILPSLIQKDFLVDIKAKITNRPFTAKEYKAKEYLELVHTNMLLMLMHGENMSTLSLLWMITLGLDMFT